MRKPNLEIYNGMPDRTLLTSKEVKAVFGYSDKGSPTTLIKHGMIPDRDKMISGKMGKRNPFFSTTGKSLWK